MNSKGRKVKIFAKIVFIMYALCLLRIVLFKRVTLTELIKFGIDPSKRVIYYMPFAGFTYLFQGGYNFFSICENYIGNLVLFIPLGIIINYYSKKANYKKSLLYGALLSISFEIIQYIFAIGTSDINDVIMNSCGALIGCFIYKMIIRKNDDKIDSIRNISIFILGLIIISITFIFAVICYEGTHVRTFVANKEVISYLKDMGNEKGTFVNFEDDIISINNKADGKKFKYKVTSNTEYYCVEHIVSYGDFANNVIANHFIYYQVSYDYFSKCRYINNKTQIKLYIKDNELKAVLFMAEIK